MCDVQGRKLGLHASKLPSLWTGSAEEIRYPALGFEHISYVAGAIGQDGEATLVLGMLGLVLAAELPEGHS